MGKVTPITEQFQHFVQDLKESFWGDLYGKAQAARQRLWEEESRRQRDRYLCREAYQRRAEGSGEHRNGYYERDFVTRFATLRLRMVRQLERDLPELLSFFQFPRHLWRKLRTTIVIERCFVEVRRRTRPMVCFANVQSVDRIVFSIFSRTNPHWKNRTLQLFTHAA